MKLNKLQKQVKNAFKEVGLIAKMGGEYINISSPDGFDCEFYGQQGVDYFVASATYTINKRKTDLNFVIDKDLDQLDTFVKTVCIILEVSK